MGRATPQERRGYDRRPPHNDSSRRVARSCGGDSLRFGRAVLIGIYGDDRDGDALGCAADVVNLESDPSVVGVVSMSLWVDVPLKHGVREVGLLQYLNVAGGREREVSRVPDVDIGRGSHVAVSVVIPLPHVVTVEHPAVEEAVIVGVSCLPCPA